MEQAVSLFGSFDENIRLVEQHLQVNVTNRETQIRITGDLEQVAKAAKVVEGLLGLVKRGEVVDKQRVMYLIMLVSDGEEAKIDELGSDVICVTAKGRPVKGKTVGQKNYINTIKKILH